MNKSQLIDIDCGGGKIIQEFIRNENQPLPILFISTVSRIILKSSLSIRKTKTDNINITETIIQEIILCKLNNKVEYK